MIASFFRSHSRSRSRDRDRRMRDRDRDRGRRRRSLSRDKRGAGSRLRKPKWDLSKLEPFKKDFYVPHPDVENRYRKLYFFMIKVIICAIIKNFNE